MSQQIIDNSGETDTLQSGIGKINDNFTEVYSSIIKTGMMIDYFGLSAPNGWVFANGGTIGKTGSGASTRANDDTQSLFELIWNSISDSECPVTGGRGASASADFSSGKLIALPDSRGRTSVGKDFATFSSLADQIGLEGVSLTEDNLPSHSHSVNVPVSSPTGAQSGGDFNALSDAGSTSVSTDTTGAGVAISVIQPSLVVNKIIKL